MTSRVNVALKPSPTVTARLLKLCQEFSPDDFIFLIDGNNRYPHLTLYMGEYRPQDIAKLVDRLKVKSSSIAAAECAAASISLTEGGYVEVGYSKSKSLLDLQGDILDMAVDLALPVAMPPHITPTNNQKCNLDNYKYEFVGDSFRPHVTLGRLRGEGRLTLWPVSPPDFSFNPTHMLIGEADEHGSVRRVIVETALKS
jgi:2'-5' RNA ligase